MTNITGNSRKSLPFLSRMVFRYERVSKMKKIFYGLIIMLLVFATTFTVVQVSGNEISDNYEMNSEELSSVMSTNEQDETSDLPEVNQPFPEEAETSENPSNSLEQSSSEFDELETELDESTSEDRIQPAILNPITTVDGIHINGSISDISSSISGEIDVRGGLLEILGVTLNQLLGALSGKDITMVVNDGEYRRTTVINSDGLFEFDLSSIILEPGDKITFSRDYVSIRVLCLELARIGLKSVDVFVEGTLSLIGVPPKIRFDPIEYTNTPGIVTRQQKGAEFVTVKDTRTSGEWTLTAHIDAPLTNEAGHALYNTLYYVNADGTDAPIVDNTVVVGTSQTATIIDKNQGYILFENPNMFVVRVDPSASYPGTSYSTTIEWGLYDAP